MAMFENVTCHGNVTNLGCEAMSFWDGIGLHILSLHEVEIRFYTIKTF